MKFSHCGRLLASAGQDHVLRVWVLRDAFEHFSEIRRKSQNTSRDREDSITEANMGDLRDKEVGAPFGRWFPLANVEACSEELCGQVKQIRLIKAIAFRRRKRIRKAKHHRRIAARSCQPRS